MMLKDISRERLTFAIRVQEPVVWFRDGLPIRGVFTRLYVDATSFGVRFFPEGNNEDVLVGVTDIFMFSDELRIAHKKALRRVHHKICAILPN